VRALSGQAGPASLRRKVTSSGVIWLKGRSYYVSRRLAGHVISIAVHDDMLVIDVTVPLHKEYRLPPAANADRVHLG